MAAFKGVRDICSPRLPLTPYDLEELMNFNTSMPPPQLVLRPLYFEKNPNEVKVRLNCHTHSALH